MPDTVKCCGKCRWWSISPYPAVAAIKLGQCHAPVPEPLRIWMDGKQLTTPAIEGTDCPCFEPKEVKDEAQG